MLDTAPKMFDNAPKPDLAIDQRFQKAGETKGGVVVQVYLDDAKLQQAVKAVSDGMGDDATTVSGLGEQALYTGFSIEILGSTSAFSDLVFVRCQAIVHVRFSDIEDAACHNRLRQTGR